jgi:Na+-transporting methylmalonyl-CoA/oxaloacetate decarboxylase gamma subunit
VATGLRREVLLLVALVLVLDALFVAVYFMGKVRSASDPTKLVFTAVWTLAILVIAIRGLSRIRSARLHKPLD